MLALKKSEWAILFGLLVLSLVPCLGGLIRLFELGGDIHVMPLNPRALASPLPVIMHIVCIVPYCLLGIFQFLPTVRTQCPRWHRTSGRVVVIAGIGSALSGLWMTQFYAFPEELQGTLLYSVRWFVGLAMVGCIWLGLRAVMRRHIFVHKAWMIRAYALGQGAGTQALIGISWMLLFGEATGLPRDILMTLSWVINGLVAEWIIYRSQKKTTVSTAPIFDYFKTTIN